MKGETGSFVPVQPMVGLAVMTVVILLVIHWLGTAWWLVVLYVVAGLVAGLVAALSGSIARCSM
jgi:hypothetical protein